MVLENLNTKENIEFIKLIAIASIVSLVNSFFYLNLSVMAIAVALQVLFLFFLLVRNNYLSYFCYYVMFMSLSLESAAFVGSDDFYGFKAFNFIGINIGVLMLFPLLIMLLIKGMFRIKKISLLNKFVKHYLLLVIIAIVLGLVHWLFNDNEIGNVATVRTFLEFSYIHVYILLCLLTIFLIMQRNDFNVTKIETTLFAIIVAVAVTMTFCLLLGNYGNRGGLDSLQVCNLYMELPCALLIVFYKEIPIFKRNIIFISSLIILALSLFFNTNGKLILSLFVTVVLLVHITYKNQKAIFWLCLLLAPVVLALIYNFLSDLTTDSLLLKIKTQQALQMISVWQTGWFDNLGQSPKGRIEEFLTIVEEYERKPWDLLLGKGYMGSVKDYFGYWITAGKTGFSLFERENRIYINMHETLNNIFLTNGVIGVCFYFKYLFLNFKVSSHSYWGVLSLFWFALFFSYSVTLAAFGVATMAVALYSESISTHKNIFQQ